MSFQSSLFDAETTAGDQAVARFAPDFASWQVEARRLLAEDIAPARVWWQPEPAREHKTVSQPSAKPAQRPVARVPKAFVDQARAVSCHCNEDRWALLYRVLWRLARGERHLLQLGGDPDVVTFTRYAKAVRRDMHKMKAFVRFREVAESGAADHEPRYVAWFEPEHFIVEYVSGFFKRRFANMRWSILTPVGCAHWEGQGEVWFSPATDKSAAPEGDRLEAAWQTYYRSIFNPARVKIRAMQSEMPQKYWKNMPEAHLIPLMLRDADRRVQAMEANRKDNDLLRCGPRPASPDDDNAAAVEASAPASLERLALQATTCRNCPLWQPATQTVFGEGPANARVMIVGEQPGDREDLAGRPFVGPAGQLLDRALAAAGLVRERLYLTNTVKHFKFSPRGKTRLHATPSETEVMACRPWLDAEIGLVAPELVICLGATAGRALLGADVRVTRDRGRLIDHNDRRYLLTAHPAYLLRRGSAAANAGEYERFVEDLARAADWV
ncbi:uracil-DNA glycosylase protein [Salinisphaera shabanensis E1L3A]|uniref:Type-4 uracil-DNA glycosylase n=1 Tax=Salinisphaera shabanensis E1L3A TaxID=1033802 RepID=U2FPU4_9GAMM|nr:UdgX family uracil-DNA binding protein [Salinisphaera shabanensis]ERJ18169.1 uracil-DNA glycosylase protein [Salinisphaera shabanensis E1L3A]